MDWGFPRRVLRGANLKGGVPTYSFGNFSPKMYKNEKIGPTGEAHPLCSFLASANVNHKNYIQEELMICLDMVTLSWKVRDDYNSPCPGNWQNSVLLSLLNLPSLLHETNQLRVSVVKAYTINFRGFFSEVNSKSNLKKSSNKNTSIFW